jgi:predicted DCC family thiol-disulfide oxidoreductase YuxK
MAPVTGITIVYDAACGLCTRAKDWIRQRDPLVAIEFVEAVYWKRGEDCHGLLLTNLP